MTRTRKRAGQFGVKRPLLGSIDFCFGSGSVRHAPMQDVWFQSIAEIRCRPLNVLSAAEAVRQLRDSLAGLGQLQTVASVCFLRASPGQCAAKHHLQRGAGGGFRLRL
jgi:hypothetical protein